MALEGEHRTVEEGADHMAGSVEGLHTAVAEGIGLEEGRHMAVADAEDSPAAVDTGYARELHMAAAVVGDTALAVVDIRLAAHAVVEDNALVVVPVVVDIRLAAHAVVEDNALVVVPVVVDIRLAAHSLEEGQGSRHSLAEVDNLVIAGGIPGEDTAGAGAADILLLTCKCMVVEGDEIG